MFRSNPKPMASLSSSLLARKGHARPAMRPQGFVGLNPSAEDLGWNDMGEEMAAPEAPPAPVAHPAAPVPPEPLPEAAEKPEVLRQRAALDEIYPVLPGEAPEAPEPVAEAPAPVRLPRLPARRTVARKDPAKPKAAFTLRLDPERHLRLRLASAVCHRSAQQLVTEALDQFLESQPELDALASHFPAKRA